MSVFCLHLLISLKVAVRIFTVAQKVLDTLAWSLSLHFTWAVPSTLWVLELGKPTSPPGFCAHCALCVNRFPHVCAWPRSSSVSALRSLYLSPFLIWWKGISYPGLPHSPDSLVYCIFICFFVWPPPHTDCSSLVAGTLLLYPWAWNRA